MTYFSNRYPTCPLCGGGAERHNVNPLCSHDVGKYFVAYYRYSEYKTVVFLDATFLFAKKNLVALSVEDIEKLLILK